MIPLGSPKNLSYNVCLDNLKSSDYFLFFWKEEVKFWKEEVFFWENQEGFLETENP
jgi:hypothetical protein